MQNTNLNLNASPSANRTPIEWANDKSELKNDLYSLIPFYNTVRVCQSPKTKGSHKIDNFFRGAPFFSWVYLLGKLAIRGIVYIIFRENNDKPLLKKIEDIADSQLSSHQTISEKSHESISENSVSNENIIEKPIIEKSSPTTEKSSPTTLDIIKKLKTLEIKTEADNKKFPFPKFFDKQSNIEKNEDYTILTECDKDLIYSGIIAYKVRDYKAGNDWVIHIHPRLNMPYSEGDLDRLLTEAAIKIQQMQQGTPMDLAYFYVSPEENGKTKSNLEKWKESGVNNFDKTNTQKFSFF